MLAIFNLSGNLQQSTITLEPESRADKFVGTEEMLLTPSTGVSAFFLRRLAGLVALIHVESFEE